MSTPQLGDTVAYGSTLLAIADDFRHQGTVVAVADDGWITVEIPQDGTTPMRITDRAENFTLVRTLDTYRYSESTSARLRRAQAERDEAKQQCLYLNKERLDAIEERDEARLQRDEFMAAADKLNDSWLDLKAELRECREQLDDARDAYGDKLCPRCSVEVAAEVAAEKEDQQ